MNFSSSFKKIICFLLAAVMLFSVAACKEKTKKKKKVIVEQVVVVKPSDDDNTNDFIDDNINLDDGNDDVDDSADDNVDMTLPERPLPEAADTETGYVHWEEPVIPEFEYEYADLTITDEYVIVYAFEDWENRKESATKVGENADGTPILADRYISQTGIARLSAYDLQTYFKDMLNIKLDVMKDTEVPADAKKILIGDTAYYKTTLGEKEFAVKVKGDDLIFEAGHVALITKSVKWYETIKNEPGKVATLKGTTEDFKSYVTLNGVRYDWVWGDEFDGSEFNNSDSWKQSSFGEERSDDFVCVFDDPHFQYIENGRLRLSADRYYNESDPTKGYASSGDINTDGFMQYRNGYVEVRARLPYRRGAFPAIWTMSNPDNKYLPNYYFDDGYGQYNKVFWTIEFDLFESFADADHMTTTLHKWYSTNGVGATTVSDVAVELTNDQVKEINQLAYDYKYYRWVTEQDKTKYMYGAPYGEGEDANEKATQYLENYAVKVGERYGIDEGLLTEDRLDEDGNIVGKRYVYYPIYLNFDDGSKIDIFDYRLRPFTNMNKSGNTYAYSFTYPSTGSENIVGNVKDGTYEWAWYFDPETINQEYHIYAFHITSDHCTVSMDGVPFLDFDWDPAYDYRDVNGDGVVEDISKNNNGVGYNLWHYLMIDMMIYTPNNFKINEERKLQLGDTPFHLYVDWIRCYQDLDDPSQAIWFPNGEAD